MKSKALKSIIFMIIVTLPTTALPQGAINLEGVANGISGNAISLMFALTALSLAPGIMITATCFPFIVTVLSILRQSIGLQQSPPNMLIVSLSIFLTWFVMDPIITEVWHTAIAPLQDGKIDIEEAISRGILPLRAFMESRTNPDTLLHLAELSNSSSAGSEKLSVLVPSFMITEIQRAFEVGFLIALPFLIIDLVVSAVLMSMGMMMVPPAVVALPFKLAFFVVIDGWTLVSGALVGSYQ